MHIMVNMEPTPGLPRNTGWEPPPDEAIRTPSKPTDFPTKMFGHMPQRASPAWPLLAVCVPVHLLLLRLHNCSLCRWW